LRNLRIALPVALAAAGVAAGFSYARAGAAPIGNGVVVIDTNLAYQGDSAAGTGVVLTSRGEILTNNHVVQGATTIKVVVPGTGHRYPAKVVGYVVGSDVAVLQAQGAANLKTLSLGNSSKLTVGQSVTFLGNAGGTGSLTSGSGTITGLGRSITANGDQGGSEQLSGLIESNVGLQPGDSGGPLLNKAGQVIGIDAAGSSSQGGFETGSASDSYSIPINAAVTLAREIEAGVRSTAIHVGGTAFLGVEVQSADAGNPALGFDSGASATSGGLIAGVVPGGPAASAGLTAGDLITALNGQPIASPSQITAALLAQAPGATMSVTYQDQSGTSYNATVTLGSGPAQ
jgi:S1-C subfamily serine protease